MIADMRLTVPWRDLTWMGVDLETTGLDVTTARIVTAAIVTLDPTDEDHQPGTRAYITNPGIPIPDEAAAVHGLTTEYVQEHGSDYEAVYRNLRTNLEEHWTSGGAVVAYNAAYDLSIIHWEGLRLGYPDLQPEIVIDPLVIDRQLMRGKDAERSRKLKPTADHHQVRLDVEHDAIEDVLGTLRILWRLRASPVGNWTTERLMEQQERWYRGYQERLAEYFDDTNAEWPVQRSA